MNHERKKYKSALILGLGVCGDAAARLLLDQGADVQVIDQNDNTALQDRADSLTALGARIRLGHSDIPSGKFSVCVVSPGIPSTSELIASARERGMPVISELELGWSRAQCNVLAITGSNGKSTLVKLCAESLKRAGLNVAIAGNCDVYENTHISASTGLPASRVVMERHPLDWIVLEVSSFQLETVNEFCPDIGVLLNVFPNHLDRHGDVSTYEWLKSRLFCRMAEHNVGIVPDDLILRIASLAKAHGPRWISFGLSENSEFQYSKGAVYSRKDGCSVSLNGTVFENDVLGLTAAAAAAALCQCGISLNHLEAAAREFQPLPHRMQHVRTINGVKFIDDSKATNIAALAAALKITERPIHLIAGGLPKGEEYTPLKPLLTEKVVEVYLIGKAARAMASAWHDVVPCTMSPDIEYATQTAWAHAKPADTILLSPACASFDQFRDFNERGNRFIECIKKLTDKEKNLTKPAV